MVKSGDTLISIAHQTGVPVAHILALNPEVDPQILIAGETLKLRSERRVGRRRLGAGWLAALAGGRCSAWPPRAAAAPEPQPPKPAPGP